MSDEKEFEGQGENLSGEKESGEGQRGGEQELTGGEGPAVTGEEVVETDRDARTWAMLCHLLGACTTIGIFTGVGAFVGVIGMLVIWLIKKEESDFVDDQGREALNFQITVLIALVICVMFVWLACIGALFGIAVLVFNAIFCIMGMVKANDGKRYRYPFSLRLVK